MLNVISSIQPCVDAEYLRILQELRRMGIAPSGNKSVDKSKLEQAKTELINKIKEKESSENFNIPQAIQPVDDVEDSKRNELEIQRLGAMNIAELNKLYFKL